MILIEFIVDWVEKQTTEKQNRPILIKNVKNWDIFEYHIGSLDLSHWYKDVTELVKS